MKNKKITIYVSVLLVTLFTAMIFYLSRDYSGKEHFITLHEDAETLIKDIQSKTFYLQDAIQKADTHLDQEFFEQFKTHEYEKKAIGLIKDLQSKRTKSTLKKEKLMQSFSYIRRSVLNYKMALKDLSEKNYQKAKTRLKFVNFYIDKARKKLNYKIRLSFANPFRRE